MKRPAKVSAIFQVAFPFAFVSLALLLGGCNQENSAGNPAAAPAEATTENSSDVAAPPALPASSTVTARAETEATVVDGANDPAIWINAQAPQDSVILGSSAEGGIELYGLDGKRLGIVPDRPVSLIDVAYGFPFQGQSTSLVVAFDTESSELVAYRMNDDRTGLTEISGAPLQAETEIEGLCLYHSPLSGKFYAFAVSAGAIQQWELFEKDGTVAGSKARVIPVGLGAGHCAVQDSQSALFYSQETVGIWKINAEPESEAQPQPIDMAKPFGRYEGDIKGLSVLQFAEDAGYLLAVDADVALVHAYDLESLEYAATFGVGAGTAVDGAEDSEGLAATSLSLTAGLPGGLLVISDGENTLVDEEGGEDDANTNYKLVAWEDVATATALNRGAPHDPTTPVPMNAITVTPTVETEPVDSYGDAADDPAIWVHPTKPELSLIIGTQKQQGLNVYALDGKIVQSLPDGRMNNVDLRYGFPLGGDKVDIVAASNRSTDSISIYRVDAESRTLVTVADGVIPTGMTDPYGACLYKSPVSGNYYVFINSTDGDMRQWLLKDNGQGRVAAEQVREFTLETQPEGCVADDETGDLYVGEEDVGIWKMKAEPDADASGRMIDTAEDGNLTDDVEGLSIFYGPNGTGYLVASSQGSDNYALYERSAENRFLGLFHVVANEELGIDGASETDGLDVTSANLGPAFPRGVFVVQDGRNITPDERQNFKLVPWEQIAEAFKLP